MAKNKGDETYTDRIERWKEECEQEMDYLFRRLHYDMNDAQAAEIKESLRSAYRAGHAAGRKEIGK